ncbi:MAG: helix-turn-helix transcriptional regulator [Arcobacteraceae bacterium]|nr:helix-turn-helix transcriptional regulator [Arcobacteraceae bacterium]
MDRIHLRLKEFIVKFGLKNKDISDKTGFSIQKVSDLRSNKQNITPEIALLFEKCFKLNPCWLIFGRGSIVLDSGLDLTEEKKEPMGYEDLYKKIEELASKVSDMEGHYGKK